MPNTTWNPLDCHTSFALSSGNLTAISSSAAGVHGVASVDGKTTGKYYVEVTIGGTTFASNTGLGINTLSPSWASSPAATNASYTYFTTGNIWYNGAFTSFTLGAVVAGNVIGIAVDLDNNKVWYRKGAGNWNGNATHNPATNTGGISLSTVAAAGRYWFLSAVADANSTASYALNAGDTAFTQTVPSGFTAGWPSNGAVASVNTFDPWTATSAITLSNAGLTVHAVSDATPQRVKTWGWASTGKYYWEYYVNYTSTIAGSVTFGRGVSNANILTDNFHTNATDGALYFSGAVNGSIWINGTNTIVSTSAMIGGDGTVTCVAVDIGAKLIWFRTNNANWNNSVTANPATGVGGLSFSSLTGNIYPAITGPPNQSWRVSLNTTNYTKIPPPAGFTVGPPTWVEGTAQLAVTGLMREVLVGGSAATLAVDGLVRETLVGGSAATAAVYGLAREVLRTGTPPEFVVSSLVLESVTTADAEIFVGDVVREAVVASAAADNVVLVSGLVQEAVVAVPQPLQLSLVGLIPDFPQTLTLNVTSHLVLAQTIPAFTQSLILQGAVPPEELELIIAQTIPPFGQSLVFNDLTQRELILAQTIPDFVQSLILNDVTSRDLVIAQTIPPFTQYLRFGPVSVSVRGIVREHLILPESSEFKLLVRGLVREALLVQRGPIKIEVQGVVREVAWGRFPGAGTHVLIVAG